MMSIIAPTMFTLVYAGFGLWAFSWVYERWMHRETFYQANRFYILLTPLLELFIPHLQWKIVLESDAPRGLQLLERTQQIPTNLLLQWWPQSSHWIMSWGTVILVLYLIGVLFYAARSARNYLKIVSWIRKGERISLNDCILIRCSEAPDGASFFRYVFWNNQQPMPALVLQHERVHVAQGHSWDVLLMEIWIALFWFVPSIYRLRTRLQETHEFIADAAVIEAQGSKYAYASLLVSQQKNLVQMPYSTFAAQLSTRLRRMTQAGSPQWKALQYAVCLPLAMSLLLFFSVSYLRALPLNDATARNVGEMIQQLEAQPAIQIAKPNPITSSSVKPTPAVKSALPVTATALAADTVPTQLSIKISSAENGQIKSSGSMITLSENSKGTTITKPLIVIDGKKLGKMDQADPNNPMNTMDPQQIAVVNVMKGEPAIAIYGEEAREGVIDIKTKAAQQAGLTTPSFGSTEGVRIKLDRMEAPANGEQITINAGPSTNGTIKMNSSSYPSGGTPLVIKNGKVLGRINQGESGAPLKNIDPASIQSITILKGKAAIDKYGKDAEDGAIEIQTKQ